MRKNLILNLVLFLLIPIVQIYADTLILPDFYIQTDYRNDSIDFSDKEKNFYRGKIGILFSQDSSLNFTYVCIDNKKEERYTYNLLLHDISEHASFIIGNYYTTFGLGHLIGRKRIYDPDILSTRINVSSKKPFTPCNSGNPVFAFNGISALFSEEASYIQLSLYSFYSVKQRFIDDDSENSGKLDSSLSSLENRYNQDYNHNEPAALHTHGSMLSLKIIDLFLFQGFYVYTDLRSISDRKIAWEYNKNEAFASGISMFKGGGILTQYEDDYITVSFEGDISKIEKDFDADETSVNKKKQIFGYGFLYWIRYAHPFLSFAISVKNADPDYYTPFGSSIGEDYPENGWFYKSEIKPFLNLRIGAAISSQKRKAVTGYTYNELPVTQREMIYLKYSHSFLKRLNIKVRRMEKRSGDIEKKMQFTESMKIEITKSIMLKLFNIYQRAYSAKPSNMSGIGFDLSFNSNIKTNINYIKAYISQKNPCVLE